MVSHPVLTASSERDCQPVADSWREALAAVATTGRRTISRLPTRPNTAFESISSRRRMPLVDEQSRVDTVVVVINLELLQRLSGLPVDAIQFEDDLDRIVAHEVYGHAMPLLLAGHLAGNCDDPAPGQSASSACAIKRENVIRKELRTRAAITMAARPGDDAARLAVDPSR